VSTYFAAWIPSADQLIIVDDHNRRRLFILLSDYYHTHVKILNFLLQQPSKNNISELDLIIDFVVSIDRANFLEKQGVS